MARRIPRRINRSRPHRVGNRYLSDYDLGWDLWYARKALPLDAPRNMQQGYVNAAKAQDKCAMASMKCAERKGLFAFLPRYEHLSWRYGSALKVGAESRYPVRRARAAVEQVKAASPKL